MRIYKPKAKTVDGKKRAYGRWYIDFADHNGQRRRIAAFESKDVSREFADRLQTLLNRLESGTAIEDSPHLLAWMNRLPDDTVKRLMQWGLIPKHRAQALRPLTEHIQDYIDALAAKGCCADYVKRMKTRILTVCNACGFTTFKNIHPAKLDRFLADLKARNYSATSRNHYADAIKGFLNWCVSSEGGHRFSGNPLADIGKERRDSAKKGVLTADQFITLVQTTIAQNVKRSNVEGRQRGILYLLAGTTGLRRLELLSLRWEDLHLDDPRPYVLARAAITKNAKEARLPLPDSAAAALRRFRDYRATTPQDYVFSFGGRWVNTSGWIKADLKAAGLPGRDREGNEIVFHSLRNSFISFLANTQTPMKVVQTLARHSDPRLTYNTYARTFAESEQEAIKGLPNFSGFCAATSAAKIYEQGQTNVNNDEDKTAILPPKTAFSSRYNIPPRGLEPLEGSSQTFENRELIDFLKRCAATGDAKKIENEANFDRLADVWNTLGQRVQNQILALAGIDLEKPTGKQ